MRSSFQILWGCPRSCKWTSSNVLRSWQGLAVTAVLLALLATLATGQGHSYGTFGMMSADSSQAVPGARPEDQLRQCINSCQPTRLTTTWQTAIGDEASRYQVVGIFWSKKVNRLPLTVATQLSYSRKWQLKAMCKSWPGPISAVMHMPTLRVPDAMLPAHTTREKLDMRLESMKRQAVRKIAEIHQHLDDTLGCKLDIMLVHEQYSDMRTLMLYPVNTLRNLARLQARTPLVGLIDVDVLLSRSLSLDLEDPAIAAKYVHAASENKKIWVLPAFITNSARANGSLHDEMQLAERLVHSSKTELRRLYNKQVIQRFDPGSTGHAPTRYGKWFHANKPYNVKWRPRYEPWVFGDRFSVPWADARFRGYGKNKIVILQALNYSGYTFEVHPTAFLMHRSHASSAVKELHGSQAVARRILPKRKQYNRNSVYGHNAWLADLVKRKMDKKMYEPTVDQFVHDCVRRLSWWQMHDGVLPLLGPLSRGASAPPPAA